MKFSDRLADHVKDLWVTASEKPFVTAMATGTLEEDRFRYYMLQDYLYLQDYTDLLQHMLTYTEAPALKDFLTQTMEVVREETFQVHLPNMKKLGISDEEIEAGERSGVIKEYVQYMRKQLEEEGLLAGLTALLQCSWVYAYIGESVTKTYSEEIARSPYKSWFDSYTSRGYCEANQNWIDLIDKETAAISPKKTETLLQIFETCAGYENRFWDVLYE